MFKKVMVIISACLIICIITIVSLILFNNDYKPTNKDIIKPQNALPFHNKTQGVTYVNGHVFVNRHFALPPSYKPGEDKVAKKQLKKLIKQSHKKHLDLMITSGYRSYQDQEKVVKSFVKKDGKKKTEQFAAKPGHSEHQTGLAFDVGTQKPMEDFHEDFEHTKEAKWLAKHASDYGFIIRYPKGQESETGYNYEPWHLRYVGAQLAKTIDGKNTNLERYYHLIK
ncbi:M15 family metallopeptidase [Staphylococcus caeli]|uniref:M15 family metallopeptidase n=1 Tax=Staphylococcus caeli TaxID=2201815 RepID=UPI003F579840